MYAVGMQLQGFVRFRRRNSDRSEYPSVCPFSANGTLWNISGYLLSLFIALWYLILGHSITRPGKSKVFSAKIKRPRTEPLKFRSHAAEALADDLARICDEHKCFIVHGADIPAKLHRLAAAAGHQDDLLILLCVCAHAVEHRAGVLEILNDKFADLLMLCRDDREILAQVDVFDHHIHHNDLDAKAEQRKQSCLDIEHKHGGSRDQHIGDHQCLADIHACILLNDHCNDIRAAGGRAAIKENCRGDRRDHHRKAQLQKRLIRKRLRHRINALKKPCQRRVQRAAVGRHQTEAAPDHKITDHQQDHVDRPHDHRRRNKRKQLAKQTGNTADAARGEIIREFEEINADGEQHRARRDQQEIIDLLPADFRTFCLHKMPAFRENPSIFAVEILSQPPTNFNRIPGIA